MQRRHFLAAAFAAQTAADVTIERPVAGSPHKGKVLALITPHLDDGPIFASGTIAKLLAEGYTGYFIRTSNDERDAASMIQTLGLKKVFDLSYRNHRMDDVARTELRGRLIFLFRLLQVDTVFSYDPWGHYEENPDHYVTAQAVEAACWMAGGKLDLPEHFAAGLKQHSVSEKYYFARGPQLVNRVVDIGPTLAAKLAAIRACRTMIDHMVRDLETTLADRKLRIPNLAGEYVNLAFERRDAATGAKYGLSHAEEFHYIGPDPAVEKFLSQNAVPL